MHGTEKKLVSFDEGLNLFLSLKRNINIKTEEINLSNSIGRVLSNDIITYCDNPPCDVSSMDGYALSKKDKRSGIKLEVIDEASAGRPSKKKLFAGKAIRIFTGAEIPKGTNTIVVQENTKLIKKNKIQLKSSIGFKNSYIRKKGSDFKKGEKIKINKIISAKELLLLASMGYKKFQVYKKLKISILSVGNELIKPGQKIERNKIYASNAHGIAGLLNNFLCECKIMPISSDKISSIKKNLNNALKFSDIIITSGGASVGNYDLVKTAVQKLGFENYFENINIKPGKPTFAGLLKKTPLIGLPGNPVSSYVCAQLFIIPLIKNLFSIYPNKLKKSFAKLNSNIPSNGSRLHFMRGKLINKNKNQFVIIKRNQDSSLVKTLQESNCLIVRPPYVTAKEKGENVEIIQLM